MSVAIAEARQTVAAPPRVPRRFGLFSVAEVIDDTDAHWMQGGLTAEGEQCSAPTMGTIVCDPTQVTGKTPRSWYSDITGDPWMTYMYETCKTVGRYGTTSEATQTRFLAAEQSAVESGFGQLILDPGGTITIPNEGGVAAAIGVLEETAAKEFGGQIIIHLPMRGGEEAIRAGLVSRFGDRLETVSGNPVVIGNYATGDVDVDVWATGGVSLHRSPLVVSGPVFDQATNDYFMLVERAYAALVDCFLYKSVFQMCACGGSGGPI